MNNQTSGRITEPLSFLSIMTILQDS